MYPPLTDEDDMKVMNYFKLWAPNVPPLEVRLQVLGCSHLYTCHRYSALLGGQAMKGRAVRVADPREEVIIRRPLYCALSPTSTERQTSDRSSNISTDNSTPLFTIQDGLAYENHSPSLAGNGGCPGDSAIPDQSRKSLGSVPIFPPGVGYSDKITTVKDASNRIREVRFFEDSGPTAKEVDRWRKSLGSAGDSIHPEYQHFLNLCATYPRMIWGAVSSTASPFPSAF